MKKISFIREIFKRYPMLIFSNIFSLLLVTLMDAVTIFSLVVIADLFFNPGLNNASLITQRVISLFKIIGLPFSLLWILIFFLFFNLLKNVLQIYAQYQILRIKYVILTDITLETFNDFFRARWYFFSSNKQGTLLNTFTRELGIVGEGVGTLGLCFFSLVQAVLLLIVPFYLSWKLTSILIIIATILGLPFLLLGKVNYRLGKLSTSTANDMMKSISESLNYAKIILGFNKQKKVSEALKNKLHIHNQATLRSQAFSRGMPLAYSPVGLVVLVIGLLISRKIALPLSETMVLFYSLSRVIPVFGTLLGNKSSLDNLFPSYEQIVNLRQRAQELLQQTGENKFSGFKNEMRIEDLSFSYPDRQPVLKNINMVIPKGKMIAVVGYSGGGKSTLIDMIMRFNDPIQGRIIFDGVDAKEFDIDSYRNCIGYVPQDSVLFNTSIRDNLLWANETATDDEIRDACRQANAEEFIGKLPDGYNTLAGDRGVRLSGGQVQRLALARAILRKPELLILDEATSALDTYSERMIQQAIENIAKGTTVVIIAHRLSTIINADYVYVLKNGTIGEEGTYLELLQKDGNFKKMVELQSLNVK
ncbi:MAG: ABC transporter ATP-binding protein [Candidatus Omnitrophica bacterium]|nr:ABC transporter ATP-binding protein [Candidatus Omnitrophota bacterium]